LSRQHSALMR